MLWGWSTLCPRSIRTSSAEVKLDTDSEPKVVTILRSLSSMSCCRTGDNVGNFGPTKGTDAPVCPEATAEATAAPMDDVAVAEAVATACGTGGLVKVACDGLSHLLPALGPTQAA